MPLTVLQIESMSFAFTSLNGETFLRGRRQRFTSSALMSQVFISVVYFSIK